MKAKYVGSWINVSWKKLYFVGCDTSLTYNKDENNKLEGLHQKPDQMERIHWEGQNFSEIVAPQEEEEEEEEVHVKVHINPWV